MSGSEPASRRDLRLVAPAICAWAATHQVLVRDARAVAVAALAAGLTALVSARLRWWLVGVCATVVLAVTVSTGLRTHALRTGPLAELAAAKAVVTVQARLSSDVRVIPRQGVRPAVAVAPAHLVVVEGRGKQWRTRQPVLLRVTGDQVGWLADVPAGATIAFDARLAPPEPDAPVAATLAVRSPPRVVSPPRPFARGINALRAGLKDSASHNSPGQAGLLPSLVVGDTSKLPPEIVEQFKATGLTHLTAVSGANLVLVLGFVSPILVLAGARGLVLRGLQSAVVIGFVLLCRAEPSVVRAAAMGLVALSALGRARDPARGLRHLAGAIVILMVVDPWLARSWGFALSVAATGGLLLWAGRWQRAMAWAPGWVTEAVAVPLAAQLATQPLVGALSGTVSVVGIVANAVSGPFVGPATVVGFLAAVTSPIPGPWSRVLGWCGGWCVEPLLLIARVGSEVPGATRAWPTSAAGLTLLTLGSVVAALVAGWVLARRWLVVLLAVGLLWGLSRPAATPGWPGEWQVTFCSVGQGDATVLRASSSAAVVVDAGREPQPVVACLRTLGVRSVPMLVLTHFHDDHIGALERLVADFGVRLVLVSPLRSPASAASHVERVVTSAGGRVVVAEPGQVHQVGAASYRVVRAGALDSSSFVGVGAESSAENDSSIIAVATVGELRVVLPGDAEPAALRAAAASGHDLVGHVIKMPHHGSSRQDPGFWTATRASVAVASAGKDNDYGHPAAAALRLAGDLGMQVQRTDFDGSLSMALIDGRLVVRANHVVPP